MAHFYLSATGARDSVTTKTGTKDSGLDAHVRGYKVGARVIMSVDREGRDRVAVYITKGSNGDGREALLCDMDAEAAKGYIGEPVPTDARLFGKLFPKYVETAKPKAKGV